MNARFQFTPQAAEDLDAIWWFLAENSRRAADTVEAEIIATCRRLAFHPLAGTRRRDITTLPVRFWTLTKFSDYVIVYRPETVPLQVVAVLHGKRDLKEVFNRRFP
jgi:plasmid stabilization system protein ParE